LSQQKPGSDCVVFDTLIEDLPANMFSNRRLIGSSGPGDNPKTAVHHYLKAHPVFEIDKQIDHKLLISVAPDGYLRRKDDLSLER
jgi:cephalosporin hydroxylase